MRGEKQALGNTSGSLMYMSHRDVRKYFFGFRVVRKWNDLGEKMVKTSSIHSFKIRYNRAQEARSESGR